MCTDAEATPLSPVACIAAAIGEEAMIVGQQVADELCRARPLTAEPLRSELRALLSSHRATATSPRDENAA